MTGRTAITATVQAGRAPLGAVLAVAFLFCLLASPAHGLTQGTVKGVVTSPGGSPVPGATVVVLGENGNRREATTAGDGSYSVMTWPDTYRVSALPPRDSNSSFTSKTGVVLGDGATVTVDLALSSDLSAAHVSGNASYPDHSPNAGVEVQVLEAFRYGLIWSATVLTDEDGNWDVGSLAPGIYDVSYVVNISDGTPSKRTRVTVGRETIFAEPGQTYALSTTLEGPKPEGLIKARVRAAEGWEIDSTVTMHFADGSTQLGGAYEDQPAVLYAPTGTYALEAEKPAFDLMDDGATTPVTVSNGRITNVTIQLPPLGLPAGIEAQREQTLLTWLNAQRARWGLPAGIVSVPLWSRGCAAHDAFGARHTRLEHEEIPGWPGFSPGGHWAGTHAVLAVGNGWGAQTNPWMDAPFHLVQLFAPWLVKTGLDDSHNYQCATTWPGMDWKRAAPGTVWTFPGDGTAGFPPVEYAAEKPTTPNEILGLPDLTGRQLFVFEQGEQRRVGSSAAIVSASLSSPSGPAQVKWLSQGVGGGIVIPVKPLKPFTKYTANVTFAPIVDREDEVIVPQKRHTWSFTTGHNNPGGFWGEKPRGKTRSRLRRIVRVSYRGTAVVVRGSRFKKGPVVIRRKTLLKRLRKQNGRVMARSRANAKGKFVARIRWPKRKRLALRVYQGGRATFGLYNPPKKKQKRKR